MANIPRGFHRHLATAILGGLAAVPLALGLGFQEAGQAEAEEDSTPAAQATTAASTDWNDHPQVNQATADSADQAATSSNETTTAHVMLYQAGHKPQATAQALGTTRHDAVDETDNYASTTWSDTHDSGHVKRYDNVTIDVTNTGTGNMSFHIWEDVKG
ncbi:MAG: hypothetical protein LBR19_01575, partial [Bifidobacteriaceae bacterium]|nr:hypothetical protein [Bifidobacteriaceae bacterium]